MGGIERDYAYRLHTHTLLLLPPFQHTHLNSDVFSGSQSPCTGELTRNQSLVCIPDGLGFEFRGGAERGQDNTPHLCAYTLVSFPHTHALQGIAVTWTQMPSRSLRRL